MLQELNEVRKKLLSFAEYAKDAQPSELVNLIATVVERIYITTENGKRVCHIFVKGCTKEDYTDLFGTADYITDANNPLIFNMCDSEQCRECPQIQKTMSFRGAACGDVGIRSPKMFWNLLIFRKTQKFSGKTELPRA